MCDKEINKERNDLIRRRFMTFFSYLADILHFAVGLFGDFCFAGLGVVLLGGIALEMKMLWMVYRHNLPTGGQISFSLHVGRFSVVALGFMFLNMIISVVSYTYPSNLPLEVIRDFMTWFSSFMLSVMLLGLSIDGYARIIKVSHDMGILRIPFLKFKKHL